MAHRSVMEMEHSDWILSGPYFAVRTAQMDRSRHALFCFGLICFKLCYLSPDAQIISRRETIRDMISKRYSVS